MSILRRLFSGHHSGGHGGNDHRGGHHRRSDYGHDSHGSRHSGWGQPTTVPAARSSDATVACMRCSTPNAAGARFCQQCGFSLRPMACGNCAAPLGSDSKFCPNCGTAVPASSG
ncbi:zinc ribbon domain-containing protein [Roseateles chitinivorans]|uniref:zinc ribbon domain-containing protein n=1 Tax=Roseateles chitinivorans TaxID=2917965 RepID=UPI002AA2AACC|nr:zinc ribbon domain-containing protein [uncultured Roseateles sp.]